MYRLSFCCWCLIAVWCGWQRSCSGQAHPPLLNAHAHNDYEHPRPLQDALDQGFTSIEADVFLVEGQLLVAHYLRDVRPERTLETLYLEPLYARFRENQGRIFSDSTPLTLLIDFKSSGTATYEVLHSMLERYAPMLSVTRDKQHTPGAVSVIISGNRPVEAIAASNPCYVGFDGRLSDLNSDRPAWQMPMISDNWRVHFKNADPQKLSREDFARLVEIVSQAHQHGRRVRFWATPESEQLWAQLLSASVDWIGTDDLQRLAEFLRQRQAD